MTNLKGKIDFVLLISVTNANPNGDPLNSNRPRENYEGYGEISDVCIKRKLRNRLQDLGQKIFVQSDDRTDDECTSLKERAENCEELKKVMGDKKKGNKDGGSEIACREWMDVRAFGQVFAFKGKDASAQGISIGVRGPVSIHQAVSVSPIDITSMQITKSVNSASGDGKASDTMGTKHRVEFGLYVIKGSINVQLAEKTGFSQEDADIIKEALKTLFENDSSSARPEGSMEVNRLYWWQHLEKSPAVTTAQIHRSISIVQKDEVKIPRNFSDYVVAIKELPGVKPEIYEFV